MVTRSLSAAIALALVWSIGCTDDSIPTDPSVPATLDPGSSGSALGPSLSTTSATPVELIGAGDIALCGTTGKDEATAALIAQRPAARVFAAGDNAYPDGTSADYQCYHASWGAFKDRTYPAVGNHEYNVTNAVGDTVQAAGAPGYFDYFNGVGVDSGRAGRRGRGYYAYDYGAWRVYALNTEASSTVRTQQLAWLKADLQSHADRCTLAYFHRPLFTSGSTARDSRARAIWLTYYAGGGDVIITGHQHNYERFAPQTPDSVARADGVRSFVVGTGGAALNGFLATLAPNSQARIRANGVIRLSLSPGLYSWAFTLTSGVVADSGTSPCGAIAQPSGSTISLTLTGRTDATKTYATLDWTGATGALVGVYRDGVLQATTENDGHYTNTRSIAYAPVTYRYKVCEQGSTNCSAERSISF